MIRPDQTRFPLASLAHMMGIALHATGQRRLPGDTRPEGLALLADRIGISHRLARRLHQTGLSADQADRYAIRIGHHPCSVWPNWWTTTPDEDDTDDDQADRSYLEANIHT